MEDILILMSIIFLFICAKLLNQDLLSPAVINLCWNVFFIIGAVIVFGTGIEWKYSGITWILLSCLNCLIGQKIGCCIRLRKTTCVSFITRNYLHFILIGIIFVGLVNPFIYLKAFGYPFKDLFNLQVLLKLNTEVAYDRYYSHNFSMPTIGLVSSIIIYMGTLIGGYAFVMMKNHLGRILSLATMVPILFLAIITNAKVGVIACSFLWVIGCGIHLINRKGTGKILNSKLVIIGVVITILGVAFLDLTMMMRIGNIDKETQLIVNNKLQEYAFGHIQAFSTWFERRENANLELGSNTYMFFTNWLGLTVRKQGVYEPIPGIASNIFTINRGIIMDFGVIGGLIYWMLIGVLSGISYKSVKNNPDNCIGAMIILGSLYFMILYGFIISPWIYSSYVLAFMGFGFFLFVIKKFSVDLEKW